MEIRIKVDRETSEDEITLVMTTEQLNNWNFVDAYFETKDGTYEGGLSEGFSFTLDEMISATKAFDEARARLNRIGKE